MKFYGKAEESAKRILHLFESGHVPERLAPIFIRRNDDIPCRQWSWSNQVLVALAGFDDARGFRQWQSVDRYVMKGEKGFPILVPMHVMRDETDDNGRTTRKPVLIGFKAQTVFGLDQTDGKPLESQQTENRIIEALPLIDVARAWGLSVSTYNGRNHKPLGWYRPKKAIALGVENLSTWAHELCHAADDRLGNLTERGQHWRSEIVAELGGAILLTCLGHDHDADTGGCWEYVQAYAKDAKLCPLVACQKVLKRTCDAVALILTESSTVAVDSAERQVA